MHGYVDIQKVLSETHTIKSSHRRCSIKKSLLKNFAVFTGKHLCQSLFFNNVADLFLLNKRPWSRRFPIYFAKFLRTPFLQNTSGRLFLTISPVTYASVKRIASVYIYYFIPYLFLLISASIIRGKFLSMAKIVIMGRVYILRMFAGWIICQFKHNF